MSADVINDEERIYREVRKFLYREADLLDTGKFKEWLNLMTEDVRYVVPVRVTREREEASGAVSRMTHMDEDWTSMEMRVLRLETEFAWAEDPPSRTRHYITNIQVEPGERDGEFEVTSNLLLYRNRGDVPEYDLLSAERQDVLRSASGEWKLARRRVILDQSVVPTHNLAVFF